MAIRFHFPAVLLLAVAAPSTASAAHPLLTEDTGTQGSGRYQLELQGESGRDRAGGERLRSQQTAAVLSYGLRDRLDIQIGSAVLRERSDAAAGPGLLEGALDASVDLKWRFFEREALSLGLRPGLTLPSGRSAPGLGSGRIGFGTLLILSYQPGAFACHAHVGYKRNRNVHGDRKVLRHLAAALSYELAQGLRLVADVSRASDPDPGAAAPARYVIAGAIWSVTPGLDLDFGLKRGTSAAAAGNAVLVGAALRW